MTAPALAEAQARLGLFAHPGDAVVQPGGSEGPLSGHVVGIKANIAVVGACWSGGLPHRADLRAAKDAALVGRLRDAGASILPGLNMDAAALGGITDNPDFGRTANPHDPSHVAGGSSGGSAAAIASGLIDMAIGTDTLGSVRIPASYCGVWGLKPTFGAVGRSGVLPLAPSLDTAGPMTAHPRDLWPLLQVIAGPDPDDTDSQPVPPDWRDPPGELALAGLRVGIPRQITEVECEPEVTAALDSAVGALAAIGAVVRPVDLPRWRPEALRRAMFLLTEAEGASVFASELNSSGTLPEDVARLLAYGARLDAARMVSAMSERRAARSELARCFAACDLLVMPTTPQRAFPFGAPAPANQADFTALANAAGVPALAVPMPHSGLPVSVQLVGPAWSDPRLIEIGAALSRAL